MGYVRELAEAYHTLLTNHALSNPLIAAGLKEGRGKFLSNAYLSLGRGINKYHCTHYATPAAIRKLNAKIYKGLEFEHPVPKQMYIQGPCEEKALQGDLTVDYIEDLLRRYWFIATITKDENGKLISKVMPDGWNGVNIFARYEAAGLDPVVKNPFFPEGLKP